MAKWWCHRNKKISLVGFCSQCDHLPKWLDGECSSGVSVIFSFGFTFYKEEHDGMQLYLAATENQFVDTGTAARLQGGRIKSLLSPAASIHSVRWARSSYCGTNVGPTGRNANWSRTKWQVSRRMNEGGSCILHPFIAISQYSCAQWSIF